MRRYLYLLSSLGILVWSPLAFSAESRGSQLYKLCEKCHGLHGEGNKDLLVPSIAGRAEWAVKLMLEKYKSGKLGKDPGDEPAIRMTSMARMLNDKDIAAVSKFVSQMKPAKLEPTIVGDTDHGEAKYAVCSACHGKDAEGNQALNAPPLIGLPDWYIFKATPKYLAATGRRGDVTVNPEGAAMVAGADTVKDEKDRRDVIDYIMALQGVRGKSEEKKESSNKEKATVMPSVEKKVEAPKESK